MRLQIEHSTRYVYEAPVYLEPHLIRMKPRSDACQKLDSFEIEIEPAPAGRSPLVESDGSEALLVWFATSTERLVVRTSGVVETLRGNPFDFLWQGDHALPLHYPSPSNAALIGYCSPPGVEGVRELAAAAAAESGGDAALFPTVLAATIRSRFAYLAREEGVPLTANETLLRGEGSCRDLTVLFVDCARAMGFAGRFVSGYLAEEGRQSHELHAWGELYLPGGGWRGFDPSTGLATADRHIAVAAAAEPYHAAPLTGSYRGRARSALQTAVSIRRLDVAAGASLAPSMRQT